MLEIVVSTPNGDLQSRFRPPSQPDGLVVLMLGGLLSDQLATRDSRAQVLDDCCADCDVGSIRFNYTAHGWHPTTRSTGQFRDVSITRMIDDALHVIEHYTPYKLAFAASSVGAGILPFLIDRLKDTQRVKGCFTVSAVSPDSLKNFVSSSLSSLDRQRLANGDDVEISSPTLPLPVCINRSQIDDLANYKDLTGTHGRLLDSPPRLLRAANDGFSTLQYNEALAKSLGGLAEDVVSIESDHEIPFVPMISEFHPWLNALNRKCGAEI